MSRTSKGPRLVWRGESRKHDGSLRSRAGWFVRDGSTFISAGGGEKGGPGPAQQKALADHIAGKYQPSTQRGRGADQILVADVVQIYLKNVAPGHAVPAETAARLDKILDFFGASTLAEVNGQMCRNYAAAASTPAAARRQLEDFRAACNHYRKEGYAEAVPAIVLPEKAQPRERWLTREEFARLLRAAWRMRQSWKGKPSTRRTGRHLARWMLVGIYTGTRSGAICAAAIRPTPESGYVDLDRGVFFRRAAGARRTKKRQPPVRLPDRLVAHMRRWRDRTIDGKPISANNLVEWEGGKVRSIKKAFRAAVKAAGLGTYDSAGRFRTDVTPHTLRHTAATWLMIAGVDIWKAAGWLGMTIETLVENYGHHHPDFQSDAATAITSKRGTKRAGNVVPLDQKQTENKSARPTDIPTEKPETNENIGKMA